eukprot:1027268-Rhodomonas_salina.1
MAVLGGPGWSLAPYAMLVPGIAYQRRRQLATAIRYASTTAPLTIRYASTTAPLTIRHASTARPPSMRHGSTELTLLEPEVKT